MRVENKRTKKVVAFILLTLSLMVSGSIFPFVNVSAAQAETSTPVVDVDKVVYKDYTGAEMKTYWGIKAPEYEGYYFGGWYKAASERQAIKYESNKNEIADDATVYAKFVPSYMLNVKVQNSANIDERDGEWETEPGTSNKTNIRMISSIDSTRYREVGFHVFVNGKRLNSKTNTKYNKTVYENIVVRNAEGKEVNKYTARDLFGLNETDNPDINPKLIIANFTNIPEAAWKTSIYVRPYWITFDGIEVRGNGRYIHVEDGIKGYVTVPVNLQGLYDDASGIVAGTLDVKYDSAKLTFIDAISGNTDAGYKAGIDLNTMAVKQSEVVEEGSNLKKIKCAAIRKISVDSKETIDIDEGNIVPNMYAAVKRITDTTSEEYEKARAYETVNNMYVTLRFKPTDEYKGVGDFLNFNVSNISFCDTAEEAVSVDIWDVRY